MKLVDGRKSSRAAFHSVVGLLLLALGACSSPAIDEPSSTVEDGLRAGARRTLLAETDLLDPLRNVAGFAQTVTPSGVLDGANAFFQSLGSNGRSCGTCHLAGEGWSIVPSQLRARFDQTGGTDPIFLPHDAATSPNADVSTVEARRAAYRLLLARGVIRVGLPVKATSDFTLVAADDPYGWASATQLSLFRRPLPTTNLRFLSAINWDGRNSPADVTNVRLGLKNQANGATVNHAKATAPLDEATRDLIVDLELQLTTAQTWQDDAGFLYLGGARGGPTHLAAQPFALGANDPTAPDFTPDVFSIYDAWTGKSWWLEAARGAIADGQRVFNEKTFAIGGGRTGTCSGCHSAPNVGSSSSFRFFDVGVSSPARRTSDVPLYTFENVATGERIQTTDPGRALISGKWEDMNRFKVPSLRALAARAPYFHDGSAPTIGAVIDHYRDRFDIRFERDERRHLEMFLESL